MHGQLGDNSTADRNTFVQVKPSGTKGLAAGFGHSMVLANDDTVWATGWNLYGAFGDGSITSTKCYVMVARISNNSVHKADVALGKMLPEDTSDTTKAFAPGYTSTAVCFV